MRVITTKDDFNELSKPGAGFSMLSDVIASLQATTPNQPIAKSLQGLAQEIGEKARIGHDDSPISHQFSGTPESITFLPDDFVLFHPPSTAHAAILISRDGAEALKEFCHAHPQWRNPAQAEQSPSKEAAPEDNYRSLAVLLKQSEYGKKAVAHIEERLGFLLDKARQEATKKAARNPEQPAPDTHFVYSGLRLDAKDFRKRGNKLSVCGESAELLEKHFHIHMSALIGELKHMRTSREFGGMGRG